MTEGDKAGEMRKEAVLLHHKTAGEFAREYRRSQEDRYASAFIYGRKKLDELLDRLLAECPKGSRVLDAGCGTGELLKKLRESGFHAVGLEPAEGMRTLACERNPGLEVLDGVITELPFDDASLDVILAIEVLRYLHPDDVQRAWREMFRVLKPGGRVIVTLVNRYALDGFFFFDLVCRLLAHLRGGDRTHCEFTTPRRARRELSALGATNVQTYGRMLALLRILFKVNEPLGRVVSRALEPLEDRLAQSPWSVPFAGHLIVVARRP